MKRRILRELKSSLLLFLWLLMVQTTSALFTVVIMLALELTVYGGIQLVSTPLWEWIAYGVLIFLFWLVMGWAAPHDVRPGAAGAVIVLTMWAALTSLMRNMDLLLLAQSACGGMLEKILQFLDHSGFDKERALTIGCFLLPAMFGMGLILGQKRTATADHGGSSK